MLKQVRAWARSHTERDRYSPVGIAFHWVMAFLVLFQLGWGWYASRMPVGGDKLHAYEVHSAAGLPVLLLAIGRVAWRLIIPGPVNDSHRPWLMTDCPHAIHLLFSACFFAFSILVWVIGSSFSRPALPSL